MSSSGSACGKVSGAEDVEIADYHQETFMIDEYRDHHDEAAHASR
jgi:hypothetical protein